MSGRPKTLHKDASKHRRALSSAEFAAVNLLCADGWSVATLSMVFEVSESAIRRAFDERAQTQLHYEAIRIDKQTTTMEATDE